METSTPVKPQVVLRFFVLLVFHFSRVCFLCVSDPYVKAVLCQPGLAKSKKQTEVRRRTTHPAFNSTLLFDISPRMGDLEYTCLNVSVYNHERLMSDDVIGEIRLGYGATEASEQQQWQTAMRQPETDVTTWHVLMEAE